MIQLVYDEGRTAVVLVCDVCHQPIRNASMAMMRWPRKEDDDHDNPITTLQYCHKGECDRAMPPERHNDPWWELEHFLARLVVNAGLDGERLRDAIGDVKGTLQELP